MEEKKFMNYCNLADSKLRLKIIGQYKVQTLTCSERNSHEQNGAENGKSIIRLSRTALAMNFPRKINFDLILFLCDDLVFLAKGKG